MLGTVVRFTGEGVAAYGAETPEQAVYTERHRRRIEALKNITLPRSNSNASFENQTITMSELSKHFDEIYACISACDDQFVRENMAFLKKHLSSYIEEHNARKG